MIHHQNMIIIYNNMAIICMVMAWLKHGQWVMLVNRRRTGNVKCCIPLMRISCYPYTPKDPKGVQADRFSGIPLTLRLQGLFEASLTGSTTIGVSKAIQAIQSSFATSTRLGRPYLEHGALHLRRTLEDSAWVGCWFAMFCLGFFDST